MKNEYRVFIGTYTAKDSRGIHLMMSDDTGRHWKEGPIAHGIAHPSFQAIHPRGRFLYSVSETHEYEGQPGGGIFAYEILSETGALRLLNHKPSQGIAPCYISFTADLKHVMVANYTDGNVIMYPIESDGRLGDTCLTFHHQGSGPNEDRQERAHAHCILHGPNPKHVYVADLGCDNIFLYDYDSETKTFSPRNTPALTTQAGAGPRHISFHPCERYAYLINELDCTVQALSLDAENGNLISLQTLSTLPKSFTEPNICADIHVHPKGHFLYASNRGHDSLAIYRIDPETGLLTFLEHAPTRGKTPRNFTIFPDGRKLMVANQDTDNLVFFDLNPESGLLTYSGIEYSISQPVCISFAPPSKT